MRKLSIMGVLLLFSVIAFKNVMAMVGEADKIAVSKACYRDEDNSYVAVHTGCEDMEGRTCIRTNCPPGSHP